MRLAAPLLLICVSLFGSAAQAETHPELHVLIDVSGSMKHTDPQNLRRPALRLLGDLLPPKADIGIWFFGNRISEIVKTRAADQPTKAAVRKAAGQIHSDEPFTDIPAALEAASADWKKDSKRNILLLSDGMVDISKDKQINARARKHVLDTLIPALKAAHVRVHTIALSKDADDKLLSTIAAQTGGIFVQASTADQLQRAFLKIFEAAAPREGLPLKDNQFLVDKSVNELTILAFRDKSDKPTKLKLPDGSIMTARRAAQRKGWRWDPAGGRDLITIENPPPGQWQIIGVKDPDNRAMIITDLKLNMLPLPNRVYPGERVEGALSMTNHGKVITKPAFTQSVDATVSDFNDGKQLQQLVLNDEGANPDVLGGDGYFSFDLVRSYRPGVYQMTATAKSPTFQRVWHQNFAMAPTSPVTLKPTITTVEKPAAAKTGEHADATADAQTNHQVPAEQKKRWLTITQDPTVIQPGTARITGQWHCGEQAPTSLTLDLDQTVMRTPVPEPLKQACRFSGTLRAKLTTGRKLVLTLPKTTVAAIAPQQPKQEHPKPPAEATHQGGGLQWGWLLASNGVLVILIGGGIYLWRRRDLRLRNELIKEANA